MNQIINPEKLITNSYLSHQVRGDKKLHYSSFFNPLHPEAFIHSQKSNFLKELHQIIEQHYNNPDLTVNELAKRMYLSKRQFFRKVKRYTTDNPSSYLRLYRLKKAYYLLENTDFLSVADISYEVGFSHPSYFSRAFFNTFGCTPSSVRKQH